jgi:hypothetical protein
MLRALRQLKIFRSVIEVEPVAVVVLVMGVGIAFLVVEIEIVVVTLIQSNYVYNCGKSLLMV